MSTVINRLVPTVSINLATKAMLTTSPSKNARSWREYAIYGITAHTLRPHPLNTVLSSLVLVKDACPLEDRSTVLLCNNLCQPFSF